MKTLFNEPPLSCDKKDHMNCLFTLEPTLIGINDKVKVMLIVGLLIMSMILIMLNVHLVRQLHANAAEEI